MSSMTRIALALLVAFLGMGPSVSKVQTGGRTVAPPVRRVLPNGVRVVIREHTNDVVALRLRAKAGVRDGRGAFFELAGVGCDYPERYDRALESMSAAAVTRVARRYLACPATPVVRPRS